MTDQMTQPVYTTSLQSELNRVYRPLVERALVRERPGAREDPDTILAQLNGPFLLNSNSQYEESSPRVVIVGQENNGWIDDPADYLGFITRCGIDDALHLYESFDIAKYRTFGRYFGIIQERIVGVVNSTNERSVLWNNLFKLNHSGKQSIDSPLLDFMLRLQGDVFVEEMRILRPDVVIFLTGPRYDFIIQRFYPDCVIRAVGRHPDNEVAQVCAAGLPELTFRTYHPLYLNRIFRRKPYCIDTIVERIRSQIPQCKT